MEKSSHILSKKYFSNMAEAKGHTNPLDCYLRKLELL